MRTQTSRKSAFTLVEIMIVVAIIGLLAAIAIPNFVKARQTAQKNACIANLKQIDGAIEQYALENKIASGTAVAMTAITGATNYIKVAPSCPATGVDYTGASVGTQPVCPSAATYPDHKLP